MTAAYTKGYARAPMRDTRRPLCVYCEGPLKILPATYALNASMNMAGPIPRNKKKRIRKKLMQAWLARHAFFALALSTQGPSGFECEKCGRHAGVYQTLARCMIEEMPLDIRGT
jgi:hypothetical protein